MNIFKRYLLICCFVVLFIPVFALASNWTSSFTFYVDSDYDYLGRNTINTELIKTTNKLYFYADKDWYNNLNEKNQLNSVLYSLSTEFEYKIYPTLTNLLGYEDKPGIDNDERIVIVLELLKEKYGGYVRVSDNYSKSIAKESNEGQIIYLNSNLILKGDLNFLDYELAHEFTHLITLKQKPDAETWFYELVSEAAGQIPTPDTSKITLKRAQDFLFSTEINLKDWKNSDKDYGKVYLFALYLKEQFGDQLFSEALKYPSKDGIISFNEALKKRGTNFDEVYLNWLITNLVNDCSLGKEYCYKNSNLRNFKAIANTFYLPNQYKSILNVNDSIKTGTGKWQKLTGGKGTLKMKFTIPENTPIIKIPYIVEDINNKRTLNWIDFSHSNIQTIYVTEMESTNVNIYFIPFLNFQGQDEMIYYYSWQAETLESDSQTNEAIIKQLENQISFLKQQLAQLQMQIALQKTYQSNPTCSLFTSDLSYGMTSPEVKCLQQFLANLGPEIYPEKLITGYYGPLTMAAVKRYQALKGIIATGYFGPLTRAQVNQEL